MNGDGDDVWFFYQVMVNKLTPASEEALLQRRERSGRVRTPVV
jgi:hypothetical protein